MNVKYPDIDVQLTGRDGNAFMIMFAVQKALRKAHVPEDEIKQYLHESTSGNYENLLTTACRWVNVR